MGRNRNQLSGGQHCVCRLLYASSKKETLVVSLHFLHTQVLELISKVPICSQKIVTHTHPPSLLLVKK